VFPLRGSQHVGRGDQLEALVERHRSGEEHTGFDAELARARSERRRRVTEAADTERRTGNDEPVRQTREQVNEAVEALDRVEPPESEHEWSARRAQLVVDSAPGALAAQGAVRRRLLGERDNLRRDVVGNDAVQSPGMVAGDDVTDRSGLAADRVGSPQPPTDHAARYWKAAKPEPSCLGDE
jgi:hypothetical protein